MAMPISAGEIYAVAKTAYDIWKACRAASSEFQQVGKEVFAMRTIVELVHIECEDPQSIINLVDKKPERKVRKQLAVYIHNCEEALKAVEALLKRYKQMGVKDKVLWALKGKPEVALLEADLSSYASQLDSYVQKISLTGLGLLNKNMNVGLGRLEDLIEQYAGKEKEAVAELLRQRTQCGVSKRESQRSQTLLEEYAEEMSRPARKGTASEGTARTVRPATPDPPRDRKANNDHLAVPKPNRPRGGSVGSALDVKGSKVNGSSPKKGKEHKKPTFTLECWLIQIKHAHALFLDFELSEKERQIRGQWKLREMAKQFNGSPAKDKLAGDHGLVKWVLKDRRKKEEDDKYTWYPHAAKIERKGEVLLGLGVEQQAMVIIKRQQKATAKKKDGDKKTLNS